MHVGIEVSSPDGKVLRCKAAILICSVDLPARASVCNMKSYNGAYSCSTCLDCGDNTVGSSHLHRYWPFNEACEIRSLESVQGAFTSACINGQPVNVLTCCISINTVETLKLRTLWDHVEVSTLQRCPLYG